MAHAYTPGLKVTERAVIRKTRRLPLLGEVLVEQGKAVSPDTIVARTDIPGNPQTVNVANSLGVEPEDIAEFMKVKTGGSIKKGEIMAEYRSFFGLFKHTVTACRRRGRVFRRSRPGDPSRRSIQVDAYIDGIVEEVLPKEGVVIRAEGAFIRASLESAARLRALSG